MSETVWLVETGEYEQRHVFGIYASRADAVEGIKRTFQAPYRVVWTEEGDVLVGAFEGVQGYSTRHTGYYSLEERPLERFVPVDAVSAQA
jgi:hypothetical protein